MTDAIIDGLAALAVSTGGTLDGVHPNQWALRQKSHTLHDAWECDECFSVHRGVQLYPDVPTHKAGEVDTDIETCEVCWLASK